MNTQKLEPLFKKVEAVVLTSAHNLRYFTGFSGGEGIAVIGNSQNYLLVDGRYTVAAKREAKGFTVVEYGAGERNRRLAELLADVSAVGYEERFLTVAEFLSLKEIRSTLHWSGVSQELETLRMIKSEQEIACLQQAEQIGVEAFLEVLPQIKVGMSESELASELEYRMRKHGGEGTSFETIAISGVKTSMPHGRPDETKIASGDFITMDFGCVYHGYCSDMTRTVAVGSVTAEQKRMYDTVKRAQEEGLAAISAGISGKEADAAARSVIADAGYGAYFKHSLGHGVGLLIHELPNLSPASETILQSGMIVTCEPGIYIPNVGGVRIEDMVCVTEDGNENFTRLSKELLIL